MRISVGLRRHGALVLLQQGLQQGSSMQSFTQLGSENRLQRALDARSLRPWQLQILSLETLGALRPEKPSASLSLAPTSEVLDTLELRREGVGERRTSMCLHGKRGVRRRPCGCIFQGQAGLQATLEDLMLKSRERVQTIFRGRGRGMALARHHACWHRQDKDKARHVTCCFCRLPTQLPNLRQHALHVASTCRG